MSRTSMLSVIGVLVAASVLGGWVARAREAPPPPTTSTTSQGPAIDFTKLPVTVDGSKEPDKIPDSLAFEHFVLAATVSHDAPAEERARRDAYLDLVRLSDADRQVASRILFDVRKSIDAIEAERAQWSPEVPGANDRLEDLRATRRSAVTAGERRFDSELTPEGSQLVQTHVRNRVKRTLKLYGTVAVN